MIEAKTLALLTPLNWTSIFTSIVSVLLLRLAVFLYPEHSHKTVTRVHTAQSLLDFTRHAQILVASLGTKSLCSFLVFPGFIGLKIYVLFNCCIAMRLHLVLLTKYGYRRRILWCFWVLPFLGAIINEALTTVSDGYSFSDDKFCYKDGVLKFRVFRILFAEGTMAFSLIYMLSVSMFVLLQTQCSEDSTVDFETATLNTEDGRKSNLQSAAKRLAVYPIICFITTFGHVPVTINVELFDTPIPSLKSWFIIGIALPGLMNSLVLFFDPAVLRTLLKCIEEIGTTHHTTGAYISNQYLPTHSITHSTRPDHTSIDPPRLPLPMASYMLSNSRSQNRSCDTLVA